MAVIATYCNEACDRAISRGISLLIRWSIREWGWSAVYVLVLALVTIWAVDWWYRNR